MIAINKKKVGWGCLQVVIGLSNSRRTIPNNEIRLNCTFMPPHYNMLTGVLKLASLFDALLRILSYLTFARTKALLVV